VLGFDDDVKIQAHTQRGNRTVKNVGTVFTLELPCGSKNVWNTGNKKLKQYKEHVKQEMLLVIKYKHFWKHEIC
jgi:hypothetical protein